MELTIRLTARLPVEVPGDLRIGLQRGTDLVDPVTVAGLGELVVEPTFRIEPLDGGRVNFLGPFAQGPRDVRFFYLCWVRGSGASPVRLGRTKIPLMGIDWEAASAAATTERPIDLRVTLADDRGRPRFATVRPD